MEKPIYYAIVFRCRDGSANEVSRAKTLKGARTQVDKRDNKYGAYVHSIRAVFANGSIRPVL